MGTSPTLCENHFPKGYANANASYRLIFFASDRTSHGERIVAPGAQAAETGIAMIVVAPEAARASGARPRRQTQRARRLRCE